MKGRNIDVDDTTRLNMTLAHSSHLGFTLDIEQVRRLALDRSANITSRSKPRTKLEVETKVMARIR